VGTRTLAQGNEASGWGDFPSKWKTGGKYAGYDQKVFRRVEGPKKKQSRWGEYGTTVKKKKSQQRI